MRRSIANTIAAFSFCFTSLALHAELRLPKLFSDHAVLQREQPIHVWGWVDAGTVVTVHLHDQQTQATADRIGKWSAWLKPEHAGGPYSMTVDGSGHAEVKDLLIGDVWVASGQSNMEFPLKGFNNAPLKNGDAEIAAAKLPKVRLLLVRKRVTEIPADDVEDTWTECTPETATNFSAVAYFFGREINAKEKVPIGLIDSTWGGTPADAWTSMNTLGTDGNLQSSFAARAVFADQAADYPAQIAANKRDEAAGKKPAPAFFPDPRSWEPAGLYNGMIAPLTPLQIKGFLWYQGETETAELRSSHYRTLFPALITDWRMHFAQGDLPFLFVQISSYDGGQNLWGVVRDAQRHTLSLRNTAMAVSLDVGEKGNIHPADKQTVGARLALAARSMVYGEHVAYQSPLFRMATTGDDGTMHVYFDNAEELAAKNGGAGGFEIAGNDGKFVAADAKIEGDTVVVKADTVQHPRFVRYGWSPVVNQYLYNAAGLPMSTFTSEAVPAK